MKIYLLISILLIYFPVLYFFKSRIIKVMGNEEVPTHLKWYEAATYLIKNSNDYSKRDNLIKLQMQIRFVAVAGILLFWTVVLLIH